MSNDYRFRLEAVADDLGFDSPRQLVDALDEHGLVIVDKEKLRRARSCLEGAVEDLAPEDE